MTAGLQIFDENGQEILALTDRITTFLTKLKIPKGGGSVSYQNDLFLNNEFFYIFSPLILYATTEVKVTKTSNRIQIDVKRNAKDLEVLIGIF